jgi:hypothetical protein
MPIAAGFARRENADQTIDSICRSCFRTIATSKDPADLIKAQEEHSCDPLIDASVFQEERLRGTF